MERPLATKTIIILGSQIEGVSVIDELLSPDKKREVIDVYGINNCLILEI